VIYCSAPTHFETLAQLETKNCGLGLDLEIGLGS